MNEKQFWEMDREKIIQHIDYLIQYAENLKQK